MSGRLYFYKNVRNICYSEHLNFENTKRRLSISAADEGDAQPGIKFWVGRGYFLFCVKIVILVHVD